MQQNFNDSLPSLLEHFKKDSNITQSVKLYAQDMINTESNNALVFKEVKL